MVPIRVVTAVVGIHCINNGAYQSCFSFSRKSLYLVNLIALEQLYIDYKLYNNNVPALHAFPLELFCLSHILLHLVCFCSSSLSHCFNPVLSFYPILQLRMHAVQYLHMRAHTHRTLLHLLY